MAKPNHHAHRPRKPTEAQLAFAEAKVLGNTDAQAALAAGLSNGTQAKSSETVRIEIAAARRWLTDITQIKRLDVIEGLLDGIEMARFLGDPANVIKGWVEVSKLLGYAAPEVRVNNLTINQMHLKQKFEGMTLEQLLEISEGRSPKDVTDVTPHPIKEISNG